MSDYKSIQLGKLGRGQGGRIEKIGANTVAPSPDENEKRLIQLGFVEGAQILIVHEGPFGGDPIVVQMGEQRIALRRTEANSVWIDQPQG